MLEEFLVVTTERQKLLHLVGGQGCWQTTYGAQTNPIAENDPAPNVCSPEVGNPDPGSGTQ